MNEHHVTLNVCMEAVPGREQELEKELRALIVPTRSEPGCLVYVLHRDPEDPCMFMFYEKFESQAALDAHVNSPHFKKFQNYCKGKADPVVIVNVTKWREID
ncbi:MAG: putative quinol monooxygenase [Bryobacteraceae bacterium]